MPNTVNDGHRGRIELNQETYRCCPSCGYKHLDKSDNYYVCAACANRFDEPMTVIVKNIAKPVSASKDKLDQEARDFERMIRPRIFFYAE